MIEAGASDARRNDHRAGWSLPALGVGPVSRNVVDAAIASTYRHRRRLMLVASRRQVDSTEFGDGYLGWSTSDFASYVRTRDPEGRILLCRDHGGSWQHPAEGSVESEAEALDSCMRSFRCDIEAGFDVLHIDTSVQAQGSPSVETATNRLLELYARCVELTAAYKRPVAYEIGFEPQGVAPNDPVEFELVLSDVLKRIDTIGCPAPLFVVAQTGTKVTECANVGEVTDPRSRRDTLCTVYALAKACHDRGALLKAHNCDYLPPADVASLVAAGVDAVNVAPEFGVAETRALVRLMEQLHLTGAKDRFLELAYASRKWEKWMQPGSSASDEQRAVIAGHYVFETDDFQEVRAELECHLVPRGRSDLDSILRSEISRLVERYLFAVARPVADLAGGGRR